MENTRIEQKERLRRLTLYFGMSLRDLAELADMSEATLYHVTDQTRGMSERTVSKICYSLEKKKGIIVNRKWLLTGEGEMIDDGHNIVPYDVDEENLIPKAAEEGVEFGVNYKEKYFALLEEYSKLQAEYTAVLKKMLR